MRKKHIFKKNKVQNFSDKNVLDLKNLTSKNLVRQITY